MSNVVSGVGASRTVSAASGGYVLAFNNLSTTPEQILPADPQRTRIVAHNPGTVDIFIAPAYVQNTGGDVALVPSPSALGGCFRVYANGGTLELTGEVQKPWQAFSASASANPLTVMPSRT